MRKSQRRPARGVIDDAALALLARHGAQILATARRYAATPEDAEDADQRGPEILLTKAPTADEGELVPWLKTVVIRTIGGRASRCSCVVSRQIHPGHFSAWQRHLRAPPVSNTASTSSVVASFAGRQVNSGTPQPSRTGQKIW